jgi:hypothetical protein
MEPKDLTDPAAILADTWARLAQGARDRHHAFHTASIATVDAAGLPQVRTVVLREADGVGRTLYFHTDRRSPKVGELTRSPAHAWLFYDPAARLQVRVSAGAVLHRGDDAVAEARWRQSQPMSRQCYRAAVGPGTPVAGPDDHPQLPGEGRENFVAVHAVVRSIEWLYLRSEGHRRLKLEFERDAFRAAWLQP